jgi:hypothetical protein
MSKRKQTSIPFRVGPYTYTVSIPTTPIIFEGKNVYGFIDDSPQKIQIAKSVRPEGRLLVLAHELAHAWFFRTGEAADTESLCDKIGTIVHCLVRDLNAAGGLEALINLKPSRQQSVHGKGAAQ